MPPGMGGWIVSEAKKLGLTFIGAVKEVAPDAPDYNFFDEEIEILPPPAAPHLHPV